MNQQRESLANLAGRIQRVEDLEAIKRLITLYGKGSDDHHNIEIMGPLFADDAVLDVGSGYGQYKGRKAIEEFLSGPGEKIILWSIHYMISPIIDFAEDGRTAKGFWYLWGNCQDDESEGW